MSLDEKNLEALLQQARWPAASSESRRRLEELWEQKWKGERRSLGWIWPVAAAASILIGIGSFIVLVLNPPRWTPGVVSIEPGPAPVAVVMKVPLLEGRPMTMRERLLVGDMKPKKVVPTTQKTIVAPPPALSRDPQELAGMAREEKDPKKQRKVIGELLRSQSDRAAALYLELVVDARTRRVALDALDDVKEPPVGALINELGNHRVSVRFAAARALGRIDGPATTFELVKLVERNTRRREALAALMYSGGEDAAEYVDGARRTPGLAVTVRAVEIQMKSVQ